MKTNKPAAKLSLTLSKTTLKALSVRTGVKAGSIDGCDNTKQTFTSPPLCHGRPIQ